MTILLTRTQECADLQNHARGGKYFLLQAKRIAHAIMKRLELSPVWSLDYLGNSRRFSRSRSSHWDFEHWDFEQLCLRSASLSATYSYPHSESDSEMQSAKRRYSTIARFVARAIRALEVQVAGWYYKVE